MSLLDLFRDDLSQISIFSRLSTEARMSIIVVNSESLQKIKYDEYDIIDMRAHFVFSNVYF